MEISLQKTYFNNDIDNIQSIVYCGREDSCINANFIETLVGYLPEYIKLNISVKNNGGEKLEFKIKLLHDTALFKVKINNEYKSIGFSNFNKMLLNSIKDKSKLVNGNIIELYIKILKYGIFRNINTNGYTFRNKVDIFSKNIAKEMYSKIINKEYQSTVTKCFKNINKIIYKINLSNMLKCKCKIKDNNLYVYLDIYNHDNYDYNSITAEIMSSIRYELERSLFVNKINEQFINNDIGLYHKFELSIEYIKNESVTKPIIRYAMMRSKYLKTNFVYELSNKLKEELFIKNDINILENNIDKSKDNLICKIYKDFKNVFNFYMSESIKIYPWITK